MTDELVAAIINDAEQAMHNGEYFSPEVSRRLGGHIKALVHERRLNKTVAKALADANDTLIAETAGFATRWDAEVERLEASNAELEEASRLKAVKLLEKMAELDRLRESNAVLVAELASEKIKRAHLLAACKAALYWISEKLPYTDAAKLEVKKILEETIAITDWSDQCATQTDSSPTPSPSSSAEAGE